VKVVHSETHVLLAFGGNVIECVKRRDLLFSGERDVLEDGGRRVASIAKRQASSHVPPLEAYVIHRYLMM
jgi:hypothetical protein